MIALRCPNASKTGRQAYTKPAIGAQEIRDVGGDDGRSQWELSTLKTSRKFSDKVGDVPVMITLGTNL